jgi:hypothetical protein
MKMIIFSKVLDDCEYLSLLVTTVEAKSRVSFNRFIDEQVSWIESCCFAQKKDIGSALPGFG